MNNAVIAAVLLFSTGELVSAVEIEARVFRFTAEVPKPAEIIRMNEDGLLPAIGSFVADLKPDGSFLSSAAEPVSYMIFDKNGKPSETTTSKVGVSFSGTATRDKAGYSVEAVLKTTAPAEIRMDRAENGSVFPQALFSTRAVKFKWLLETGTWDVVVPSSRDSAILIRIRE